MPATGLPSLSGGGCQRGAGPIGVGMIEGSIVGQSLPPPQPASASAALTALRAIRDLVERDEPRAIPLVPDGGAVARAAERVVAVVDGVAERDGVVGRALHADVGAVVRGVG